MKPRPSPVKEAALRAGVPVLQPGRARDPAFRIELERIGPDVCVVVAYGRILPKELLEVPRLGFVNVHFSLLPAYRGAAPVQRAVMDGLNVTGVSIMVLTEGMDEGPVLATEALAIEHDDSAGTLGDRLALVGAELLVPSVMKYADGSLAPVPQDGSRATYAPKIGSEEARISWDRDAGAIRNHVRGLNPAPGAWTTFRARRVKIARVELVDDEGVPLAPGELRADDALIAGTGSGPLEITSAQMEGRKEMNGAALARGLRLEPGDRFD